MRRVVGLLFVVVALIAAAVPSFAAEAKSFANVPLVDVNCSTKVKDNPDAHTRECALKCAGSGYGVWADGKYLKFDAAGNDKAKEALKAITKKDGLRVDVSGQLDGDQLKVESLALVG